MAENTGEKLKTAGKILLFASIFLYFGKDMLFDLWHMSGGYGAHETSSGDIYMGEVSGRKPEGQGLYISVDRKWMYFGEWKKGDRHGEGLYIHGINHGRFPAVYYFEISDRDLMYLGHQADRISNNKSIRLWRKSETRLLRPLLGVYESDDQKIKIDLRKNFTGMLLDLKSVSLNPLESILSRG